MDIENYFKSLNDEITSLKNRIRNYIGLRHLPTDGIWKESVIRTILKRHLPDNIGVGQGFIIDNNNISTQIDILLYDKNEPLLFKDGDFIITTANASLGAIEVKTNLKKNEIKEQLDKLARVSSMLFEANKSNTFIGLFSYEKPNSVTYEDVFSVLREISASTNRPYSKLIHCVAYGKNIFIRFWGNGLDNSGSKWHAYSLSNKAYAYFIHNIIGHLCPNWTHINNDVWYPQIGKEGSKIGELPISDVGTNKNEVIE